ncbi:hypothetical protein DFH09DRAFT_1315453 [Mycena vulgaris]|nr:hypothetical protein DFH09DRAFT_1315453 [Mycena vulgaris]
MTEYDFSPEAYTRHFETQARIARWMQSTHRVPQAPHALVGPPPRTRVHPAAPGATATTPHGPPAPADYAAKGGHLRRPATSFPRGRAAALLTPATATAAAAAPPLALELAGRAPHAHAELLVPAAARHAAPGLVPAAAGPQPVCTSAPVCWLWRQRERREAAWAKKPLQDYAAARDGSSRPVAPVFPVSAEALDDMSPNMVAQTVTDFLLKSYKAAFGDENIPWPAITTAPDQYYDVGKFELVFSSSGLQGFKSAQWHGLGGVLAAGAGEGSSGFFRKGSAVACGEEGEEGEEEAERSKRKREEEDARVQEAALKEEEDARVREAARKEEEEEAERLKRRREEENARVQEAARKEEEDARVREAARKEEEEEAERLKRKREEDARVQEAARKEEEEKEAERVREEEARQQEEERLEGDEEEEKAPPPKGKKGRKRKADEAGFEPEEGGAARRTARTRQTPAEAEAERQKKMAAVTTGKRKPGYSYIEKTPVKKGRGATSKPCAALARHHIRDPPSDERAQGTLLSPPLLLPPYIPAPAPHTHISPFAVPSDYRCRSTVLLRNAPLRDYRRRGHPPTTAPPSHIPPCPLHPVPRRCGTSVLALPRCGDYPSHPHLFPRSTTHL